MPTREFVEIGDTQNSGELGCDGEKSPNATVRSEDNFQ